MAGFGIRDGRRQAKENLSFNEGGDCARCGGSQGPSSLPGYLQCSSCGYEWADPNHSSQRIRHQSSVHDEQEKINSFRNELESGSGLARVLGIEKDLSDEQEQQLGRLQDKWMTAMKGHYNAAEEERKPLMISFDDEGENLVNTEVGAIHISHNDFDGGEEVRVEYPGYGTEFYGYNEDSSQGWRRGRSLEETARNMAAIINRRSKLVHAFADEGVVVLEMRDNALDPASLVLYVDDPGGKNLIAEKHGVSLDPDDVQMFEDYQEVLRLVLDDGIITPSEDQLLWVMRQNLGIDDAAHVRLVLENFSGEAVKECPGCGGMASLYPEHTAWWCEPCQAWL